MIKLSEPAVIKLTYSNDYRLDWANVWLCWDNRDWLTDQTKDSEISFKIKKVKANHINQILQYMWCLTHVNVVNYLIRLGLWETERRVVHNGSDQFSVRLMSGFGLWEQLIMLACLCMWYKFRRESCLLCANMENSPP